MGISLWFLQLFLKFEFFQIKIEKNNVWYSAIGMQDNNIQNI